MLITTILSKRIFDKLYADILEFRTVFDLPVNMPDAYTKKSGQLHHSLLVEEMTEIAEATTAVEQADGIADSLYVLFGDLVEQGLDSMEKSPGYSYLADVLLNMAKNLNIDIMPVWDEVHRSNLSKACENEDQCKETMDAYSLIGVETVSAKKGGFYIVKCAKDTEMQGKPVKAGKVLKSKYYSAANIAKVLKNPL
jgi:predicted HAD superfamily Cof-like phosphohydrolase